MQCFSLQNYIHGISYCESFTESKFGIKYVSRVKWKNLVVCVFKSNWMVRTKIPKQIDCKRSSSTKQMNRVQNIRIEISK